MSRSCDLTGVGVMTGNNVSHANNKTRRVFRPNLCSVHLLSDVLERSIKLRVTAATLRTVEHRGGLDSFLLKAKGGELSQKGLGLKREIEQARQAAAPAAAPAAPSAE